VFSHSFLLSVQLLLFCLTTEAEYRREPSQHSVLPCLAGVEGGDDFYCDRQAVPPAVTYCTACRAKELLSCRFLAFPAAAADCSCCCRLQLLLQIAAAAADFSCCCRLQLLLQISAAVVYCTVYVNKTPTEITRKGMQGPAIYVQYDSYLGVASE
jgi:hypothetical protein